MLSEQDRMLVQNLARACTEFEGGEYQFRKLLRRRVRPLLDFTLAVAAIGPSVGPQFYVSHIVGIDTPPSFLRAFRLAGRVITDPVFQQALAACDPIVVKLNELPATDLRPCLRLISTNRVVLCGRVDAITRVRSCFVFAGLAACCEERVVRVIHTITPFLHIALLRLNRERLQQSVAFTRAEREIIECLLRYESNKAIASSLRKSHATVRNQLHGIYRKIGVGTRAAAVGRLQGLTKPGGEVQRSMSRNQRTFNSPMILPDNR